MAKKLYITSTAFFSTDGSYIIPSLPLDLSSSNLNFSDNFTIVDPNATSNFLKYISLTGWQMSATAGELHDFLIDGTSYLQISETEITPAVPFANIKTTGLIQGSQETKASTTNLGVPTANLVLITGTTTIATMATTGITAGTDVTLRFGNALTLNHSGVEGGFALTGSVNKSVAAGNRAIFRLIDLGGTKYWLQTSAFISDS